MLLHGTGGNEEALLSLGRELDPEAALLSPRGKVLENGALRFFRRFAEGVFDEEDVVIRANELADFVSSAASRYEFNVREMIAVGYSNGANIASVMMLLRPESIFSAILLRGMTILSNPPMADLSSKRVLISAGRHDPIIPLENAERLRTFLQSVGAEVTFEIQEASHGLVRGDVDIARRWLAR